MCRQLLDTSSGESRPTGIGPVADQFINVREQRGRQSHGDLLGPLNSHSFTLATPADFDTNIGIASESHYR